MNSKVLDQVNKSLTQIVKDRGLVKLFLCIVEAQHSPGSQIFIPKEPDVSGIGRTNFPTRSLAKKLKGLFYFFLLLIHVYSTYLGI